MDLTFQWALGIKYIAYYMVVRAQKKTNDREP